MTNRSVSNNTFHETVPYRAIMRSHIQSIRLSRMSLLVYCFALLSGNGIAQQPTVATLAQGSVPTQKTAGTLSLSLDDAIRMALRQSLAGIESIQAQSFSRGQRLVALSKLLPALDGSISEHAIQSSMVSYGIDIPAVPTISGPYQYQDARLNYTHTLFSASSIQSLRSAKRVEEVASLSIADARKAIVLMTGAAYLAVVQASSHVSASTAQVEYANALHTHAVNALCAGTGTRIDETRTAVQLDTEHYNLVAAKNSLAIAKITLARVIGLQPGQAFEVTNNDLSTTQTVPPLDAMLAEAQRQRPDLAAAERTFEAALLSASSTKDQRLPEVTIQADYGDIGTTFAHSHGIFDFAFGVNFPVFTGGRINGLVQQAEAFVAEKKAELANLSAQIDADVRTAYLNLNAAREQAKVAQHNLILANDTLSRARDRFQNGVTDSVEVVQAQQSLSAANDQIISSTYALNMARLNLARATGSARSGWKLVLGGTQ